MGDVKNGAFVLAQTVFRNWIRRDGSTAYLPESGRYHLYVSYACPFASRCLFVRAVKGLEDVISLSVVGPHYQKTSADPEDKHRGWVFLRSDEFPGCIEDTVLGCKTIREIYEHFDTSATKFSVPVLFDKKTKTIVNNESSEIIRMLSVEFDEFSSRPGWNLYPESLQKQIDEVNAWVYPMINGGVYRTGFAQTQEAYNAAVKDVFDGLDRAEEILSKQRYIASPTTITEADVRLFVTLVRFDEVYHGHFKCNKKLLAQYPNLINHTKEMYQIPGVASTVNMLHIREHYHRSHPTINPFGIVPIGPGVDFTGPHNRDLVGPPCPCLQK